jgi:glucan phosphoethanolaminetransferase (alkaline phosphatase superfamily)
MFDINLYNKIVSVSQDIAEHLSINAGLYLFYIGTTLISLHYLNQRKKLKAVFFTICGLIWVSSFKSTFGLIGNLGADSFHEANSFDASEAVFWLQTFFSQFSISIHFRTFLFCSFVTAIFYFVDRKLRLPNHISTRHQLLLKLSVGWVFIVTAMLSSAWGALSLFYKNTNSFVEVSNNFVNITPVAFANPQVNIMLYIGESTSIMNMGIYGYPRKTTPELENFMQKDDGFIKFHNIFSTHTHTSPSLLEALSINATSSDEIVPIDRRRRVSIVDVLNSVGISTELISNQGATGTWNQASSVIFKNAKQKFSTKNRLLGNADHKVRKPWDHAFFNENITSQKLNSLKSTLLVFHSYAGHGRYLDNIPSEFHQTVDDYFIGKSPLSITGRVNSISKVEAYDSAVRYIDFSVTNALKSVKGSSKPWVLIYFSDHGESVFTNRAHDSSRFIHEMARVPLVMYFNNAAKAAVPNLYNQYSLRAKKLNTSTLAQLPSTLFDLFAVKLDTDIGSVIGSDIAPQPIVVRETKEGISAVNLSVKPLTNSLVDKTDSATEHFVSSRQEAVNRPTICYHRSNTIAKALRGSLVSNCLEIDIVIDENGEVFANHPPAQNTGLKLEDVFNAVKSNENLSFWLDGKNLASRKSCSGLLSFLAIDKQRKSNLLVEFPSDSHQAKVEISDCVQDLKAQGFIRVSYYVPTKLAINCSDSLKSGKYFYDVPSCRMLKEDLTDAYQSKLFTDISFDYAGIKAIESISITNDFVWNIWHVKTSDLPLINPSRFGMVILRNNDPNNM